MGLIQMLPHFVMWYSNVTTFCYVVFKCYHILLCGIQMLPHFVMWYSNVTTFCYVVFKCYHILLCGIQMLPYFTFATAFYYFTYCNVLSRFNKI